MTDAKASVIADREQDYWRLRDFEYAQPLYDLAFLLEIDAISRGEKKPKYRTFALWKAAIGIDSYQSIVDKWLEGTLSDHGLDQVPSSRIKTYLQQIRDTGSIPELANLLLNERFRRCLRLRRLRGLGPAQIAQTLDSERPPDAWFAQAARNCNLPVEQILRCFDGESYGAWQPSHVVPPLLRLLRAIEDDYGSSLNWGLQNIPDWLLPITSECRVTVDKARHSKVRRVCERVVARERMFRIVAGGKGFLTLGHSMGWSVRFDSTTNPANGSSASEFAHALDPLTQELSVQLQADLHLHTSWSDGAASLNAMARAASHNGLTYIAVTDHSRSCKLQRGLTPVDWFRQSSSLLATKPAIPVLHGIEVDILQDGRLDLPTSLLAYADFVVASVHTSWTDDPKLNTRRLISAIETGCIDVVGHPTSALTGKPGVPDYVRPRVELDWTEVFACCKRWHVAVEFNCFPSRFDLPPDLLRKAIDVGCWLALGSDSHARAHLEHLKFGQELVRRMEARNVLNLLPYDEVRNWLRAARESRARLESNVALNARQTLLFHAEPVRHVAGPLIARPNPPAQLPSGSSVVGLDLTGGAKRTGVALLTGNHVETCSLLSDDELLTYIRDKQPRIVSIDSPLGLPGGGNEVCPRAGIVRVAEYDLSSIGISAYPALIGSMKELTLRGIRLRSQIAAMDPAPIVIESYPGAAQDILCLPRKQRSLGLLREGLAELGLSGPGLYAKSHDEIDAITSAVVGRFYECGDFEAMGVRAEAELIVPKRPLFSYERPPIICLSGRTAAGKSVIARYLAIFYGFEWCKTRDLVRDLLIEESRIPSKNRSLHRQTQPEQISEKDLQEFGFLILTKRGQEPLRRKLRERIASTTNAVVIDAIRDVSDLMEASLKGRTVIHWHVDCSDAIISARLRDRAKHNPQKSAGASPVDELANPLQAEAHRIIPNFGSLEELRWTVDDEFFSLVKIARSNASSP